MSKNRPMPLTGEKEIPLDPILGKPLGNFPSRRGRALLIGWSTLIATSMLLNYALIDIEAIWVAPFIILTVAILSLVIGWWVLGQWNREVIFI